MSQLRLSWWYQETDSMKSDWMKLTGYWILCGPIVSGCLLIIGILFLGIFVDHDEPWYEWLGAGMIAFVLVGGSGWAFSIILFRETRDAIRSIRQDKTRGRCLQCSYLLRGNVSGICPECGTPIPHHEHIQSFVKDGDGKTL
jgi:hypothetical protein